MNPYVTLSETMNELRKEGYVEDFNLQQNCLECRNGQFKVFTDEFKIDKYYRFEGQSNPSDQHSLKGVLVNAYGIYSDSVADKLMEKLEMRR